jgi:Lon protease-like protein
VLLPTERVPLHIFEPRYRELIRGCLADQIEFGHEFDDGRLNIVVEGRRRIRIRELTSGRSFITADVEPVEDEPAASDPADVERALRAFRRLVEVTESEGIEAPSSTSPQLSYELAARVDFGIQVKQRLLELTSEPERLAKLLPLMRRAVTALTREREVRDRSSANGKVSFGT